MTLCRSRLFVPHGLGFLLVPAILGGCASNLLHTSNSDFDTSFATGNYSEATTTAQQKGRFDKDGVTSKNLLWSLQAGSAVYADGHPDKAIQIFDQTEDHFKIYDEESAFKKYVLNNIGATLVNDKVLDYRGQLYDATMMNSYKALGFMAEGHWEYARVELNRAMDRQRRAAEFFKDEINTQQEEVEKKQKQGQPNLDKGMAAANEELSTVYTTMDQWKVYPDFINPLVSYLRGVFLLSHASDSSDFQKAADAFKEAYGMNPDNTNLASDLKLADAIAAGHTPVSSVESTVWVLVENGLGPLKEAKRIDIPAILFAPHGHVAYTGIAYPKLKLRDAAYDSFVVYDGKTRLGETQVVADIDRLVQTEFKKRFPGIITRAVVSAALKTAMQAALSKKQGTVGMLAGAAYQLATTQADTRIWSALPKDFQAVRVPRPESGKLTITTANGAKVQVSVPDERFSLVHVHSPQPGVALTARAYALGTKEQVTTSAKASIE